MEIPYDRGCVTESVLPYSIPLDQRRSTIIKFFKICRRRKSNLSSTRELLMFIRIFVSLVYIRP